MTTIKKLKSEGNVLAFELQQTTPALANALRRIMLEVVPVIAIEDIEFHKNSSALYDEIVAHRLGLIPLSTDLKGYTVQDECTCEGEGCAKCTVQLTLKAKGPGTVYAKDLKSRDPSVKPVYPDMPIVKLLKGQEMELIATAAMRRGKEHVKWSPCLAWYRYAADVEVNNNSSQLEKCKDKYPQAVFDKQGKIDKKKILDLNLVDACDGVCEDVVKVTHHPENIIFNIESWGQLPPKQILTAALDIFKGQVQAFDKEIK